MYSFLATEGSREVKRELTNEALEALMEQAVAAIQNMDPDEFKAKVSVSLQQPLRARDSDCIHTLLGSPPGLPRELLYHTEKDQAHSNVARVGNA